jgi:hypothetical protein
LIELILLREEEKQLEEIRILVDEIDVNPKEIGIREKAEEYLITKIRKITSRITASKSRGSRRQINLL